MQRGRLPEPHHKASAGYARSESRIWLYMARTLCSVHYLLVPAAADAYRGSARAARRARCKLHIA